MKYKYSRIMVICFSIIFTSALFSCSSDDDDKLPGNIEQTLMAHGWKSETSYDFLHWGDNISLSRYSTIMYFLGNGQGIFRFGSRELDTEFGSSTNTTAESFDYYIKGSKVIIDKQEFTFRNNSLISVQSGSEYKMIQKDDKWIEDNKYKLLPIDQRFDFTLKREAKVYKSELFNNEYSVFLNFSIKGSDKLYSKGFSYILATYTIRKGKSKTKETEYMYIQKDTDMQATHILYGTEPMEVSAQYEIYDTTTGILEFVDYDNYSFP
ncbi:MAG: hypothetical protein NC343_00260 [Muribaculum sp.]|nr:hypothetical protein [Muribaculaceae bacterium]MCM1080168.1 hypothetical protein [Muribaculum sp.]